MPQVRRLVRVRIKLARGQHGRCHYCMFPVWNAPEETLAEFVARSGLTRRQARRFRCTLEHLRARCDGGSNSLGNLAAACLHCNRTRHRCADPLAPERYGDRVRRAVARGCWHPGWAHAAMRGEER